MECKGTHRYPGLKDIASGLTSDFKDHTIILDTRKMTRGPKVKLVSAHIQKNCFPDETEAEILAKNIEDLDDESVFTKLVKNYHRTLISRDPTSVETFFMNRYGVRYLFRGILLPLSDDGENIDFIWCVLNWKEDIPGSIADLNDLHDKIMGRDSEGVDAAMEASPEDDGIKTLSIQNDEDTQFTESNDTPDLEDQIEDDVMSELLSGEYNPDQMSQAPILSEEELVPVEELSSSDPEAEVEVEAESELVNEEDPTDSSALARLKNKLAGIAGPAVTLAKEAEEEQTERQTIEATESESEAKTHPEKEKHQAHVTNAPKNAENIDIDKGKETPVDTVALMEVLEETRKAASRVARVNSKTRHGLYRVLEGAYKLFAVSRNQQEAYQQLLAKYDLKEQSRAPFTPVMKLIFGKTYDKTRLTEYAAAISWAWRNDVAHDDVSDFISGFPGGIKGCVKAERREKRKMSGKTVDLVEEAKKQLKSHEVLAPTDLDASEEGDFVLLLARKNDQQKLDVIKIVDDASTTLDAIIKKATTTAK